MFGKKVLGPKELVQPVETTKGITSQLDKADIIAAMNGPMAHVYVKSVNGWNSTPEMSTVLDIAEIFRITLQSGNMLPQEMRERIQRLLNSIDVILVRDGGQYKVLKGFDASGTPQYDTIESLTDPNYVEAKKRINGMNHEKRSGDIILIFKDFTNDIPENRYTSASACKSWHGSLNSSDSYVPFIVAYPSGNKSELEPFITKVCPDMKCEGNWKVTDLIKTIIETQYSNQ